MLPALGAILKVAAPVVLGMLSGKKTTHDSQKRTQGMRLDTLGPQIQRMLQQQQAQQQQQYGMQMQRYSQADPLREAVMKLAMSLMPRG